jgi:hypothetical protein
MITLRRRAHNQAMQIRIEGRDLPGRSCGPSQDRPAGYHDVHVGVQRRGKRDELLGVVPGDGPDVSWTVDATVRPAAGGGADLSGPYIQGPPGGRFIYLNWGTADRPGAFEMFRRAKLWLEAVPPEVVRAAAERGVLVGRLALTDASGHPLCASVRPPLIEWSAASALPEPFLNTERPHARLARPHARPARPRGRPARPCRSSGPVKPGQAGRRTVLEPRPVLFTAGSRTRPVGRLIEMGQ